MEEFNHHSLTIWLYTIYNDLGHCLLLRPTCLHCLHLKGPLLFLTSISLYRQVLQSLPFEVNFTIGSDTNTILVHRDWIWMPAITALKKRHWECHFIVKLLMEEPGFVYVATKRVMSANNIWRWLDQDFVSEWNYSGQKLHSGTIRQLTETDFCNA